MRDLLTRLRGTAEDCRCTTRFVDDALTVDAASCPGRGDLVAAADCRATVVEALRARDAEAVVTRADGIERRYEGRAAAILLAAGRFAEHLAHRDERLISDPASDPLGAAREASGRAGPVADLAARTGFLEAADGAGDYETALRPFVGSALARARVTPTPPPDVRLIDTRSLETGATATRYERPGHERRRYHLEPVESRLGSDACALLDAAYRRLAAGATSGGDRAPLRAVAAVLDDREGAGLEADGADGAGRDAPAGAGGDERPALDESASPETLADVLEKHTRGFGVLDDLFADERVTDVFATAPAGENPLRVRLDGDVYTTNVRLTDDGAAALASRLRSASGRSFSRASPTLDAVATDVGVAGRVRAAGVRAPVSDGLGFAFRRHEASAWTLPRLVDAGTLAPRAAGLLSLAVERSAATLVAGTRGAGKTTLLGALLWELPAATRLVVMEDTPELPVESLQEQGRDVQALQTELDAGRGVSPTDALRTALRMGEGALALGEVRGEEAQVLYEAMRVGANGSAVLGTIHGDGASAVRERVVSDLGVSPGAFAATDLVVTMRPPDGGEARRLASVEEVVDADGVSATYSLFEPGPDGATSTGRLDRGESHLLASLARPDESYAALLDALDERAAFLSELAETGRTDPSAVAGAHEARRAGR